MVKYIKQLSEEFHLFFETTGLACNYLDRYLTIMVTRANCSLKRQLRMIASVCVLLAAKFYDCQQPSVSALEEILRVPADQLIAMECMLLDALGWALHVPLPHAVIEPLRAIVPTAPFDDSIDYSVATFIDNSLETYELLDFTIAEIAAGAILAAWKLCKYPEAVMRFLPTLARACTTFEHRLLTCSDTLLPGSQTHFPERAPTGVCCTQLGSAVVCSAEPARLSPPTRCSALPLNGRPEKGGVAFERPSKRTRHMNRVQRMYI